MLTDHPPVVPDVGRGASGKNWYQSNLSIDLCRFLVYIGGVYFLVMTSLVVPIACTSCFMIIYPLRFFHHRLFNALEHGLCNLVNDHWVAASVFCGLSVVESGEDITPYTERRCLLLSNHLGLIDHFALMTVLQKRGSVPGRYLWVIYNIWKYTPLGLMWTAHGNFFVNGGSARREALIQDFKNHLKRNYRKFDYGWIVMYPEGSRCFLIKESSRMFAEKIGVKPLKNCALPRTGAAHAVIETCGPKGRSGNESHTGSDCIEFLVDVTLGYPGGDAMTMGSAMFGDRSPIVHVNYKIHRVKSEWSNEETLREWLFNCYREKDDLLEEFNETGAFPGEQRPLDIDRRKAALSEFFWMFVFYFLYYMLFQPIWSSVLGYMQSLV